jgi:cysteinyl-tRNA synthetase
VLTGSLTVGGVKMSKSLGNFVTIKEALELYSPEAIRLFILSGHYRKPVDFTREAVLAAERGVERLANTVRSLRLREENAEETGAAEFPEVESLTPYAKQFLEAMDDDFNTPQAIAALFDLNREVNKLLDSDETLSKGAWSTIDAMMHELGGEILGIIPDDLTEEASGQLVDGLMEIVLDIRARYREAKRWNEADALRDRLAELGIGVEDRPDAATWHLERGST